MSQTFLLTRSTLKMCLMHAARLCPSLAPFTDPVTKHLTSQPRMLPLQYTSPTPGYWKNSPGYWRLSPLSVSIGGGGGLKHPRSRVNNAVCNRRLGFLGTESLKSSMPSDCP